MTDTNTETQPTIQQGGTMSANIKAEHPSMPGKHDYAAYGMGWEHGDVNKRVGAANNSQLIHAGESILPIVTDLAKFRAHFGDDAVRGMLNASNSLRVMAQGVRRNWDANDPERPTLDNVKYRIYNKMRGIRTYVVPAQTITKRSVADGTFYEGTDEVEYRQLNVAAYVDEGLTVEQAQRMANKLPW